MIKVDTIDVDGVIERIKLMKGLSSNKGVASLFGLSPEDFSNRKRRGSLLPLIIDWAVNENVHMDWLLLGVGQKPAWVEIAENNKEFRINEQRNEYGDPVAQAFLKDWLRLSDVVKMRVWTLVKEELEKLQEKERA